MTFVGPQPAGTLFLRKSIKYRKRVRLDVRTRAPKTEDPECDRWRVLDDPTCSTFSLVSLLARWSAADRAVGGMSDANKVGVQAVLGSLVNRAAMLGTAKARWDIFLVLSPQVRTYWRLPLPPSGPKAQTVRLVVNEGKMISGLQALADLEHRRTEEQDPLKREAGTVVHKLQSSLQPNPLNPDDGAQTGLVDFF